MTTITPNTSSLHQSTVYLCGTCRHPVEWEQKAVLCEVCDVWFHICCQEIPSTDYSKLDQSDVVWKCTHCNSTNQSTTSPAFLHHTPTLPTTSDTCSSAELSIGSLDEQHTPILTSSPTKYRPQPTNSRPLRIINVNCQSISSKKGAWGHLLHTTRPDIIIATETWLDKSVASSELESEGYQIYRRDRTTGSHGGVLIAVNLAISSMDVNIQTDAEISWVKIHCRGHRDIFVAACYRPHVSDKWFTKSLRQSMEKISKRKRPCAFVIGGDFNLPGWDWPNNSLKPQTQYVSLHHEFMDLLNDYGLSQHVNVPTRESNILDLVMTNLPEQINRVKVIPGISDHDIAYLELSVKPVTRKQQRRKVWLYNKADWRGLADFLKPYYDRLDMKYHHTPDEYWTAIKNHLLEGMAIYIPRRTTKRKDSCPWIDKELHHIINTRDRLYDKSKDKGSAKAEQRFKMYKQIAKKQFRKKHAKYVHNLFTDEEKSKEELSKRFWTYVKHRKSPVISTVGPFKSGNQLVTEPEEKANILNDQFVSVFSKPSSPIDYNETTIQSSMPDIKIAKRGVWKQLNNLKPNKAAGPDGISPRVYKELASVLAGPLTNLFQLSLDKGIVPSDWKKAAVCPIFKKGEKYDPANYRPVSLTSVACKVLEHIITSHIMNYAEDNSLLHPNQHGFRKSKSCEKQLIELISDLTTNMDDCVQMEACILDFSKAFDKVSHQKLLGKLASYGISHQLVSWIDSFLSNRVQTVVVDGKESREAPVSSGVPQGSILGPALFLYYINDLPDTITSTVRLFADDTIIYNTSDNHEILQDDLQRLEAWEKEWDMEFHPLKCQHVTFTRKTTKRVDRSFRLHSTEIPKVDKTKYLGVTINSKVTWNDHITSVVAKANAALGFVRRNVITSSEMIKVTAYKQLVRPLMEYASAAWDSLPGTLESSLEAVQRRAARFICNILRTDHHTSTTGLLSKLNLDVLSSRRTNARLRVFSQYHFSESDVILAHLKHAPSPSVRRHSHQYLIPHSNTLHHQRSFFIKTAKEWNTLPTSSGFLVPPSAK